VKTIDNMPQQIKRAFSARSSEKNEPVIAPIIKKVIKNSGILIPEFFVIGQKAFSKLDPAESNKPRKELSEEMAEKKRLKQVYGDSLRNIYSEIKQYMSLKKHCYDRESLESFLESPELQALRKKVFNSLKRIHIESEEIEKISDRFIEATEKVQDYQHKKERKDNNVQHGKWNLHSDFRATFVLGQGRQSSHNKQSRSRKAKQTWNCPHLSEHTPLRKSFSDGQRKNRTPRLKNIKSARCNLQNARIPERRRIDDGKSYEPSSTFQNRRKGG